MAPWLRRCHPARLRARSGPAGGRFFLRVTLACGVVLLERRVFFFSVRVRAAPRVLRRRRRATHMTAGLLFEKPLGERAMAQRLVTAQRLPYQSSSHWQAHWFARCRRVESLVASGL